MKLFLATVMIILSGLTAQARSNSGWKPMANETIWPNAPFFRDYHLNDGNEYSEVMIQVDVGVVRVSQAIVMTESLHQLPLWNVQGDYVSPRRGGASFPISKLRSLRIQMQNLQGNGRPARVVIYIR
ncbi:hypothetical protein [Bdellovibrio reynosensis]|uniref:Uncharacterized protein n=1 Tax=Bdellovibrio reynosensis TaxID=2835041 RepID=A0ABY4CC67_9BACT|nr:hypothetical protein [Bdellovibrio reynosensis]UOF02039.1 hypothetical protein MNR06_03605 [Bdellovibrio reynosensis]